MAHIHILPASSALLSSSTDAATKNKSIIVSGAGHTSKSIRAQRSNTPSLFRCIKIAVLLIACVIAMLNSPTAIADNATYSRDVARFDEPFDPGRFAVFAADASHRQSIVRFDDTPVEEQFSSERVIGWVEYFSNKLVSDNNGCERLYQSEYYRWSGYYCENGQQVDQRALAACRMSTAHAIRNYLKEYRDIANASLKEDCAAILNPISDEIANDVIYPHATEEATLAQLPNQEKVTAYRRERDTLIKQTSTCLINAYNAYMKQIAEKRQRFSSQGPSSLQDYADFVDDAPDENAMQLQHSADKCLSDYNDQRRGLYTAFPQEIITITSARNQTGQYARAY